MNPTVSIIIATRNREENLDKTLSVLQTIKPFQHGDTEIVVVDNNSTDTTRAVVEKYRNGALPVSYFFEGRAGKTTALNTAMIRARGDILLWTDDDVIPPVDWINNMCLPIWEGRAEAVSGKIRMAPDLERPWMTRTHYDRLADTRFMGEDFGSMIGANMAFHRKIRERVPWFDPELGPGRMGFWDDSLFSLQVAEAGYKIASVGDAVVEHHFEPHRLQYREWIRGGEAVGRSFGYVKYHWFQEMVSRAAIKRLFWLTFLRLLRACRRPPQDKTVESCDRREIRILQNFATFDQILRESERPYKYTKRGLIKIGMRQENGMRK